jgi:hypothetical protein
VPSGADDPTEEQLKAAFGGDLDLAREIYWYGWDEEGFPGVLIDELADALGIETVGTILGDAAVNTRVVYDCFSADPTAAIDGLRDRLALVQQGVRALRASSHLE